MQKKKYCSNASKAHYFAVYVRDVYREASSIGSKHIPHRTLLYGIAQPAEQFHTTTKKRYMGPMEGKKGATEGKRAQRRGKGLHSIIRGPMDTLDVCLCIV